MNSDSFSQMTPSEKWPIDFGGKSKHPAISTLLRKRGALNLSHPAMKNLTSGIGINFQQKRITRVTINTA